MTQQNPIKALAKLTGLEKNEVRKIAEAVMANHALLRACPKHNFLPIVSDTPKPRDYQCEHCKGTINSVAFMWYTTGLRHANDARAGLLEKEGENAS